MRSQAERAAAFRALHAGAPFVIPNPWNPGSARALAALGFQALASTSADVLHAPRLRTTHEIRSVCAAVSKPVNVLARPNLTMAQITDAGATRVSLGGSLTWAAVDAMVSVATAIVDRGDFSGLRPSPPPRDWFASAATADQVPDRTMRIDGGRRG